MTSPRYRSTHRVAVVVAMLGAAAVVIAEAPVPDAVRLRFEPEPVFSESLPEDSVPRELMLPEPEIELVSIPAIEATTPRATNPTRLLSQVDTGELVVRLDADRLLLSEIRKPVPESREEAASYLARLKELSGIADPVRLVPLANRVLDQAPIYFDWLSREYANQDEQIVDYYVGGARGFSFALDNFRTAVMLSIMNRLDLASRIITEMESTR